MSNPAAAGRARLESWIRLVHCERLTPRLLHDLLREFGSPEVVVDASAPSLARVVPADIVEAIRTPDPQTLETTLEWAATAGNHLLTWDDPRYPPTLLELTDPPPMLFCKGDPLRLEAPSLAMVGSRNASPGGLQTAEEFAEAFAQSGVNVVSGLALGIDAAAHRGALKAAGVGRSAASTPEDSVGIARSSAATTAGSAGAWTSTFTGSTIAVIGTGIDRVYPSRNRDLAHAISERGAILSEFPLGMPPLAHNFPRRNRLISGLARGVLVVEAALESGSLITARFAGEQGKDVFAIPGSIHSPFSKGCHRLIKEGAKLVETAQDVLEELRLPVAVSPASRKKQAAAPAGRDFSTLLDAVGFDPVSADAVAARTGWPIDRILSTLLQLELAGSIARLPGDRVQRVS